ncbi:hypothetical protein [Cryobacterium roopkundense]|uniref:DUF222 domain-containing protein n=1 Tax=Cryobacterium roopkundense TaxID=1001240 RepID=A0A7W9E5F3_9MICO|nr:hypothetical protein [Cryobacterium roopkundense]MBB5643146.1 hypothetical protein [Cryobacterium roopkundense]
MANNDEVPHLEDAAGNTLPEPVDQTLAVLAEEKAVADDTQTLLLDAILSFDRMVCFAQAARAEVIDKLRQWTDATAEAGLPRTARGRRDTEWSPQKAAHEGLVAELAALLKLPSGVARNLMFESDLLQHRPPRHPRCPPTRRHQLPPRPNDHRVSTSSTTGPSASRQSPGRPSKRRLSATVKPSPSRNCGGRP